MQNSGTGAGSEEPRTRNEERVPDRPIQTDFLVIGSGIAGLWFSYRVARAGRVLIVTKKNDTDSNTNYAQGGIASAFGVDDSPDLHGQDTIRAGEGLCHGEVVRIVAEEGPELVKELHQLGIGFDTYRDSHGDLHFQLGREGGHLRPRIVHAKDYTGQEVERGLIRAVKSLPSVTLLEDRFASDLLIDANGRCAGCVVVDEATGAATEVQAGATLLATGGVGQVYLTTTNPTIATGDGIAMAFRAGARIANMEFIQFHPTALYGQTIDGRAFLISEAVRGEGGVLKTRDGKTFMERYHELGNLAPRDVVARAVDNELKRRGEDYVVLDVTHLDPDRVRGRFPNIHQQCLKFGIDLTRQPIPVVPAAHYVCGGIETNVNAQTSIAGLYAAGECGCSGLHGANRLASNSLLEALVLSERAAKEAAVKSQASISESLVATAEGPPGETEAHSAKLGASADELAQELKRTMSRYAAIVRSERDLSAAWEKLTELHHSTERLQAQHSSVVGLLELRNMVTVGRLIVHSARLRKESRGLHYNADYPGRDDVHYRRDTVLTRKDIA
jgi:L-aspartate oxidase